MRLSKVKDRFQSRTLPGRHSFLVCEFRGVDLIGLIGLMRCMYRARGFHSQESSIRARRTELKSAPRSRNACP